MQIIYEKQMSSATFRLLGPSNGCHGNASWAELANNVVFKWLTCETWWKAGPHKVVFGLHKILQRNMQSSSQAMHYDNMTQNKKNVKYFFLCNTKYM